MLWRRLIRIPLARKISLLFGIAVLLTIVVTLLFPWQHMRNLHEEAVLMQAHWVASVAYQAVDLHQPDWAKSQSQLVLRWPFLQQELGLPSDLNIGSRRPGEPRLQFVKASEAKRSGKSGFLYDAYDRLSHDSRRGYDWTTQDQGRLLRFALAVRSRETDIYPKRLLGFIDVGLRIPQTGAVWNAVITILAGASGAVLAIMIFYTVTQRIVLTPVTNLRLAAERVTTGDLETRSIINSGDEFEDLSGAFNEMLVHLQEAHLELKNTNRSLDVKLGELAETNVSLFESNRVKSEFLTNVTHELRTPLVSIIGFAELLRDAWDDPKADRQRLHRYSENILSSGRSLLDIINDLLDLAKIEAGKIELHITEFPIEPLCRDLIDLVRPLADKKKQVLTLEINAVISTLNSDSGKIKQILYNLLSNAIKFTPDGGKITLYANDLNEHMLELTVSDDGPGIDQNQRESIFDKFHQVDSSRTREYEGTGLGLAITKELAEVLGGSIRLTDDNNPGASFAVNLPFNAPQEASPKRIRLN